MTDSGRGPSRAIWRTVDGVYQRRCALCGEWLPADKDHFYYKRDKLQSQCRPCARADARERQRTAYVPGSRSKVQSAPTGSYDAAALLAAMKVKP